MSIQEAASAAVSGGGQAASDWPDVLIDKTTAKLALRAAAFTETHKHCDSCTCDVPADRQIIHSRLGGIGADHDLLSALDLVEQADELLWTTSMFRHDLAVCTPEHTYFYAVQRPERSTSVTAADAASQEALS